MANVAYRDLGRMAYGECWQLQQTLFDALLARKSGKQAAGSSCGVSASALCGAEAAVAAPEAADAASAGWLLAVEHPPVYTLGKSGREANMLADEAMLRLRGAEFHRIDRGGDVTFHGPGQLVVYPILDLEKIGLGLRDYIDRLEEAVIRTVASYGIAAGRIAGASGVWLGTEERSPRKICAIGVRSSRYVTMHGFALNVSTDLGWFELINPCGFTDRGATSLERETGRRVAMEEVKDLVVRNLSEILKIEIYKK